MPSTAWPPGVHATRHMVSALFVCMGVGKESKDVEAMCHNCQQCQLRDPEGAGRLAAPLHTIPVLAYRFFHVHVDLVGHLPASSEGHVCLLTAIDRPTRWVEAVLMLNMEASSCIYHQLGCSFWRAGHCHNGQGHPIHLCNVVLYMHTVGYPAHAHLCLPPSEQWDGGACAEAN
jgi:hypothetical protein